MKKCIVLIIILLVLAGCSAQKQNQTETGTNALTVEDGSTELISSEEGSEVPEQSSEEGPGESEQIYSEKKAADEPTDEEKYQQAIALIKEKHYPQAMGILRRLEDYKDSKSLLQQLRYLINGSYICNGAWLVAALTDDGRVLLAYNGSNAGEYAGLKDWKNVISLSSGGDSKFENVRYKSGTQVYGYIGDGDNL